MLNVNFNRRELLTYGTGCLGAFLANKNVAVLYADDYTPKMSKNENSVIFLWMGGGATHIETFNPIPNAPIERRSTTGFVDTKIPSVKLGGLFKEVAKRFDKINVVRSFAHKDSSHQTATHWVVGGEKNQGGTAQNYPSYGAMVANFYGPVSHLHGLPTYIKMNKIEGDGAAWLGQKYMGYEASKEGIGDLQLKMPKDRFMKRKSLLDLIENHSPLSGQGMSWREFQSQAVTAITGKAAETFRVEEDAKYDTFKDNQLGKDALSAIRAIQNGAKFVNIQYGGWDMHSNIVNGLKSRQVVLDKYIALLIDELQVRGLFDKTLLVVATEFGRTPKINSNAGRDHWSGSIPLMLAGGGYEAGRVIGKSNANAEVPQDGECGPADLRWTILNHMGLHRNNTWMGIEGRPMPVTGSEEKNILTDIHVGIG